MSVRLIVLFVVSLAPLLAQAQSPRAGGEIGVTAALNPNATGAPAQSEPRLLEVGVNVFANERIVTTAGGQVQMLFVDESAFTVGPDSDVVLDEFVFDPGDGTGKLALTAAKGVFRFVGGKISKNTPVTLKTPTAVIGIRGGIALVNVQPDGATRATFLFGDQMTVAAGGVTQIATRPGFAISAATSGQAPSPPVRAAPAQLNAALNSLERSAPPPADDGDQQGGNQQQQGNGQQRGNQAQQDDQQQGQDGQRQGRDGQGQDGQGQGDQGEQGGGRQQVPTDQDVAQTSIGDQGSRQAPRVVALRRLFGPAPPPPPPGSNAEGPAPGETANEAQQNNNLQQNLAPSATDLSGRIKRSASRLVGTADQSSTNNIAFSGGLLQFGSFSVALGSNTLKFPVSGTGVTAVASAASTASPNGAFTGNVFLSSNFQFAFLEGIETANTTNRIVAFAGKPSGSIPTSGISYYALQDDFGLNSSIPFMRFPDTSGITVGLAESAADAAIYWDVSGSSTAQRSFGFRTISITGQGLNQKSAASFGGGAVLLDSQGRPFIKGGAIGSARQDLAKLPTLTDSDLASADDSLGNDFFGPNGSYFVLESAKVSLNDVLISNNGAERFEPGGSPQITKFFPNNVAVPAISTLGGRSTRTMGGYLGGAYQTETAGALSTTTMLFGLNNDSFDVEIKTNAAANKVRGSFKFVNAFGSGPTHQVIFGDKDVAAFGDGSNTTGDSIFIDNDNIAAGDQDGGGSVTINSSPQNSSSVAFVSVSEASDFSSGFIPSGVSVCDCKYLNWGFWGGRIANSSSSSEMIHLANYVVGEIAGIAAINGVQGTATYTGHAIGTVFTGSQVYQAIGGLSATVNFDNVSASTFNITNFDGANYTGTGLGIASSGARHRFTGSIAGAGRTGSYNGSFMKGGGDVAAEMGGQFKVDGGGYSAVGIFAAKK